MKCVLFALRATARHRKLQSSFSIKCCGGGSTIARAFTEADRASIFFMQHRSILVDVHGFSNTHSKTSWTTQRATAPWTRDAIFYRKIGWGLREACRIRHTARCRRYRLPFFRLQKPSGIGTRVSLVTKRVSYNDFGTTQYARVSEVPEGGQVSYVWTTIDPFKRSRSRLSFTKARELYIYIEQWATEPNMAVKARERRFGRAELLLREWHSLHSGTVGTIGTVLGTPPSVKRISEIDTDPGLKLLGKDLQ
jgi:hypothetical protein